ncbi:Fusaric acid resistance protein-like-domain-containing protein [Syncephalis fuscata]|nr:Fusaric acid resistance protein-like-domain-containing protein [Syncephalis fuscata]
MNQQHTCYTLPSSDTGQVIELLETEHDSPNTTTLAPLPFNIPGNHHGNRGVDESDDPALHQFKNHLATHIHSDGEDSNKKPPVQNRSKSRKRSIQLYLGGNGNAQESYFNIATQNNDNNRRRSMLSPQASKKDQRGSMGSVNWRRLQRYVMHHQPTWSHSSPGGNLPPLPLPMTPGQYSARLVGWKGDLDPVVHVVLDDGTIRRRRMTSRSLSDSDKFRDGIEKPKPLSLQQEIAVALDTSSSSSDDASSSSEAELLPTPTKKYQATPRGSNIQHHEQPITTWYYNPISTLAQNINNRIPPKHRRTLKAAFAYFIASLATFWEVPLSGLADNQHIWLHYQYGLWLFSYSIGGTIVTQLNIHGHTTLSEWVGVIGVGGIGTFGVAAAKAWLKRPSVYTAGSVASLTMYVGVARIIADESHVKTIDWDALIGPQQAFLTGISICLIINYVLWTQKASKDLCNDVASTLQSFNGLLRILVKTFLLDGNAPVAALPTALAAHRQSFASLKKSLHEAQLEPADPIWPHLPAYASLIDSLNSLTQHVSGLSSCIGVQREMLAQQKVARIVATLARKTKQPVLVNIENDQSKGKTPIAVDSNGSNNLTTSTQMSGLAEDELRLFLEGVGPVMRALSYTCKRTITQLHRSVTTNSPANTSRLLSNLDLALVHFNREKSIALRQLYTIFGRKRAWARIKANIGHTGDSAADGTHNLVMDNEDNNSISEGAFPVYFFLFSLQKFAHQLKIVVEQFDQLQVSKQRTWWTAFKERLANGWSKRSLPDIGDDTQIEAVWQRFDPKSMQDTLHSPRPKTAFQRFSLSLVKSGDMFKQFKMRYAIKSALFAMLLIAPAFMDNWRETYQSYRGEWAVISMAVVMTPTVGGSNVVAIYRIIGTILGSVVAYLAYTLFPGSRIILPCVAFLFALPCFHLVMHTGYPRVGQFSCMTFTTVLMSQYAVYEDDELEIRDVALTRAITVTIGVIIGLLGTIYVWPYEARAELRRGICDFFINLNLNDTTAFAQPLSEAERMARSYQEFLALEMLLQLKLLRLQDLLALTRNEPRLKGPFPIDAYGRMLGHCQALIDRMLTLRMAITDVNWVQKVRKDFVQPVQSERRRMNGAIELYMYSAAAALLLKMPVPAYLPPIAETWHALIARVRKLPEMRATVTMPSAYNGNTVNDAQASSSKATALELENSIDHWRIEDERFVLYFAYVLAMGDLVHELEGVGTCLRELYGVMGGRQAHLDSYYEA